MERNRRRVQWSNYHLYTVSPGRLPEDNIRGLSQQPSGGPHVQLTQPRHLEANSCPKHLKNKDFFNKQKKTKLK